MSSVEDRTALELLDFWVGAGPERWFTRSDAFDTACETYVELWERAKGGGCDAWAATAAGNLALIVLLDQIPRNVFRGEARQYTTDTAALGWARFAVERGHDLSQGWPVRNFFYLPFQHAEDMEAQDEGLALYRRSGQQEFYYYQLVHADAIRRFGRFPHRNAMLGRDTTEAERAYLDSGGFAN